MTLPIYTRNEIKVMLILGLVLFCPKSVWGSFESENYSPLQNAAGAAPFSLVPNSLGIISDPTGLTRNQRLFFAGSQHNKFGLKSLKESLFVVGGSFRGFGLGLGISNFGNPTYQELLITAMGTKQIKDGLKIAISYNLYQLNIKNYGQDLSHGLGFIMRFNMNPFVESMVSLLNVNRPTIGKTKEKLPQTIMAGLLLKPSEKILAQVSLVQDTEFPVSIRFGIIMKLMDEFGIAFGRVHQPNAFTAGAFINFKNIKLELACLSYVDLGFITYQTGISFSRNP
jgi:hypothetical protein